MKQLWILVTLLLFSTYSFALYVPECLNCSNNAETDFDFVSRTMPIPSVIPELSGIVVLANIELAKKQEPPPHREKESIAIIGDLPDVIQYMNKGDLINKIDTHVLSLGGVPQLNIGLINIPSFDMVPTIAMP